MYIPFENGETCDDQRIVVPTGSPYAIEQAYARLTVDRGICQLTIIWFYLVLLRVRHECLAREGWCTLQWSGGYA